MDTVLLKRLYDLVFIEHGIRRMHLGGEWTVQQARNLALTLGERLRDIRFLISRPRGSNFTASFDAVFQAAGSRVLRTAVQAPRMNAICERLVGTLRRELLDRVLILGEQHLHAILAEYQAHYNTARPHQGIAQHVPDDERDGPRASVTDIDTQQIRRKPVLNGLINERDRFRCRYPPAARRYRYLMAESAPGGLVARVRAHPDALRAWVPALAAALVLVAAFTDPAGWARLAVLVLPVALLALWARWPRLPLPVLAIGVIVPVVVAQLTGGLEPSMFLVSLLAFMAGRWEDSRWQLGLACLAVVVTPVVVVLLQPADNRIAWQIWIIGITFPVVLGQIVRSQERLTRQLGEARRQLAIQAQAEARRRIARDIHDVVGQSLAGVLVQVASARHVLRRDVDGAEAALIAAETAGRRALGELRGTVSLLRSDEEAVGLPMPEFGRLGALVDSVRGNGLEVDYRENGDLDRVEPAVGVALYRIAQEALHNAMQHAPRAATSMVVTVTGSSVALQVDTIGRDAPPTDHDRPRYGLTGMRERAVAVGGTLHAGPTPRGWQVRCEVPRDPS